MQWSREIAIKGGDPSIYIPLLVIGGVRGFCIEQFEKPTSVKPIIKNEVSPELKVSEKQVYSENIANLSNRELGPPLPN